jgi:hypothetical protein
MFLLSALCIVGFADKVIMSLGKIEDIVTPKVVGYSPKAVKVYSLGMMGAFVPFIGIVPSIMALAKSKKAEEEIALSNGSLSGYDIYKKGIRYAWFGIVSFLINIGLIGLLIWAIPQIPNWVTSPEFQSVLQSTVITDVTNNLPANLDLESLGFTTEEIEIIKSLLPEGTDINNLSVRDILNLAAEYGIVSE